MMKRAILAALSVSLMSSPTSSQVPPRCLHGSDERPDHRTRREQALVLAREIHRAQNGGPALAPFEKRTFRSFDQLTNLPPTPADFKVQLDTSGATYTFSLKDMIDPCRYAVFSDQEQALYEALARREGTYLRPA